MFRSANRRMECEDSEEERSIREIYVEGFDGNLDESVLERMMKNYFESCGEITKIEFENEMVGRCAIISIRGKSAEEKALRRSGSDAGGWTVVVSRPKPTKEYLKFLGWNPEMDKRRTICVTGYDTSRPRKEVEGELREYFSSCGAVQRVEVAEDRNGGGLISVAVLSIYGDDVVEKVQELCGSDKGDFPIRVSSVLPTMSTRSFRGMSAGFTIPTQRVAKKAKKANKRSRKALS